MTRAPLVNPTVHGVKGLPVEFGSDECSAPGCQQRAQQRHHLWPKSYLRGQPYEWVSVNGILLANSIGLCVKHHAEVTGGIGGHEARIIYDEKLLIFEWWERHGEDWFCLGPLHQAEMLPVTEAQVEREKEGLCPTCGHATRKPVGPPRKTKSWTVKVPDDAEDGAVVLDEYVDDISVAIGYGDVSKGVRRYHVIVNVFAWLMTVKPAFLADWEEANEDSR